MKVEIRVVTYLNPLFLEVIGLGLPTIDPMMAQDTADLTALLSLRSIDYRFPKFCKPGYAVELPIPLPSDTGSAHFSYASASDPEDAYDAAISPGCYRRIALL